MNLLNVKDHPIFATILTRFETGEYTLKHYPDRWDDMITIYFKTGFCKGFKIEAYHVSFRENLDLKFFIHTGFLSRQYLQSEMVPPEIVQKTNATLKAFLKEYYDARQKEYSERMKETLNKL